MASAKAAKPQGQSSSGSDTSPANEGAASANVKPVSPSGDTEGSGNGTENKSSNNDGKNQQANTLGQEGSTANKTLKSYPSMRSERKIGHRRVDATGQVSYKKVATSQIMESIQLGIRTTVSGLSSKPERDLLMQDFQVVEAVDYPAEGSNLTPAHRGNDFRFKTYAPMAFRYFRALFGIAPDDYLISLCNNPLHELSNPGASGSVFYISQDDEFIVKTVQHKEAEFLQELLPGYYMNLNQNPRTLLPKTFGLYCYQCGGKNIRLLVMNNLLPTVIKMHTRYDLKGSTYKRRASKSERAKGSPTRKDLDFMEDHPEGLLLERDTYDALIKTLHRDCRVLESFKIMDYSLLVGVHNLDLAARERLQARENEIQPVEQDGVDGMTALGRSRSVRRERIAAYSTAMESIQAEAEPVDLDQEDVPQGGIPARNSKGERLLLFIGIIDILQRYRLKKKLEHTWKAMVHDGDSVSVHRPGFYAQRFLGFMEKSVFQKIPSPLKHSPSKKKGAATYRRQLSGIEEPNTSAAVTEESEQACSDAATVDVAGTSTPPPSFSEAIGETSTPSRVLPASRPIGAVYSGHSDCDSTPSRSREAAIALEQITPVITQDAPQVQKFSSSHSTSPASSAKELHHGVAQVRVSSTESGTKSTARITVITDKSPEGRLLAMESRSDDDGLTTHL